MVKTYPVLTFAAFLNCSKLEVLAFRSRLLEVVDSASEPESRSERNKTDLDQFQGLCKVEWFGVQIIV